MWVLMPGARSAPRNLNAMLREYRDALNEDVARAREQAEAAGAPLEGLDPLPPFEPDPELEGLEVVFRHVSRRDFLQVAALLEEAGQAAAGETLQEQVERLLSHTHTVERFLSLAIAEVRGVVDEAGPVTIAAEGDAPLGEHELEVLQAAGLTTPLFSVAKRFQMLTGEKKRLFGLPRPTTS